MARVNRIFSSKGSTSQDADSLARLQEVVHSQLAQLDVRPMEEDPFSASAMPMSRDHVEDLLGEDDRFAGISEDEALSVPDDAKDRGVGELRIVSWNTNHMNSRDIEASLAMLKTFVDDFPDSKLECLDRMLFKVLDALDEKVSTKGLSSRDRRRTFESIDRGYRGLMRAYHKVDIKSFIELVRDLKRFFQEHSEDILGESDLDRDVRVELDEKIRMTSDLAEMVDNIKPLLSSALEMEESLYPLRDGQRYSEDRDSLAELGMFFDRFSKTELGAVHSSLHSHNVLVHTCEMFNQNPWLDCVGLQEVNDPALLDQKGLPFDIEMGPVMVSRGKTKKGGQREVYPLLIRKGSGLCVNEVFIIDGKGEKVAVDGEYHWDKTQDRFRPIVVYEVQKGDETPFLVGIVHNSPESDGSSGMSEASRQEIFRQVENGLKSLQKMSSKSKRGLVVIGDYYLSPEAIVSRRYKLKAGMKAHVRTVQEFAKKRLIKLKVLYQKEVRENGKDSVRAKSLNSQIKHLDVARREEQIVRNIYRLTFGGRLKDMKLREATSVSGTNAKTRYDPEQEDMQIADFMVHNLRQDAGFVGLLRPDGGMSVDSEELAIQEYFSHFSDHLPVAGVFTSSGSLSFDHPAIVHGQSDKAVDLARVSNRNRFARLILNPDGPYCEFLSSEYSEYDVIDVSDEDAIPEEALEALALEFLNAYVQVHFGDEAIYVGEDLEVAISHVQSLEDEYDVSEFNRLFITLPADFEGEF